MRVKQCVLNRYKSVSYTHLDVYKRQGYYRPTYLNNQAPHSYKSTLFTILQKFVYIMHNGKIKLVRQGRPNQVSITY